MSIKVGVIFGGESVEHEVSIISAVQAMSNLNLDKYEVVPIYIAKDREWYTGNALKFIENYQDMDNLKKYLKKVVLYRKDNTFILQTKGFIKHVIHEIDIAFPIVHGTNVEDGTLQGYLETIGIPYVGSNVYSAAVGQDKVFMKQILASENIPIAKYTWFFDSEFRDNEALILDKVNKIGYPVIVKPAMLGSSIGISKAHNDIELKTAIIEAVRYDNKVVVEEVVSNLMEVNVSVLGNYEYQQVSEMDQVISNDDFLTYDEKYGSGGKKKCGSHGKGMSDMNRILPAKIDSQLKMTVSDLAMKTFRILNSSGVCRIDFLIDNKTNQVYVNEINTIPGDLAFYLWDIKGKKYPELLDDMINIAIKTFKKRMKKTYSFETNILSNFNGLKGCKGFKNKIR